jgi:hypothetical protein
MQRAVAIGCLTLGLRNVTARRFRQKNLAKLHNARIFEAESAIFDEYR